MKIAPSILSADFSNLGEDIKQLEVHGADWVHIDVMDGLFVPNISFGAPIMKSIRPLTKLPFDVHLMIQEPSRYIEDFVKAGADIITIHAEADKHLDRTVNYIKSFGVKAGIALNPATPIVNIKHVIGQLDMVLIMSVNPGFGGQKYINYSSSKIQELRQLASLSNKDLLIQVDGGIDTSNIREVVQSGVDVVVAGSSVFKNRSIKVNISDLRRAAEV